MTSSDQARDAFVERLFDSAVATMDVFTVYLGDRLGLYRALAEHGPLTAGARVADIACGVGWAAISIARAYPNTTVDGFDLDEASIALARANAAAASVDDRVSFETRDAADPASAGQYDLAVIVEA